MILSPRTAALAAAVGSSMLSSLAWLYQDKAVQLLSPAVTACFLDLTAALILFLFLSLRGRLPDPSRLWLQRRDLLPIIFVRALMADIVYCYALTMTSGLKMMFFTKLEPYFVLALAWLAGRCSVTRRQLVLLTIHICGAVILSTNAEFSLRQAQYGDILVVLIVRERR